MPVFIKKPDCLFVTGYRFSTIRKRTTAESQIFLMGQKWPKSGVSHFSSSKEHRAKQGVKGESKPDCSTYCTSSIQAPAKATPAGSLVQIQPKSGLTWSMIRRWFRDPSQESLAASSRNPASTLRTATLDHSGIFTIFGNDNMYTISFRSQNRRIAESEDSCGFIVQSFI
ncbi:uncharacterized protein BO66DRAFT_397717 [Aspergillus aculeatinus CBS 121060]|uniref:Uncharacterized protein n=1 Tax=Aspergillus aculeatinus CBS 121060 TaxID=1448322 RepID=A0ACD1HM42_9EURO|nr:hypothetical protein BO66DRAFT_397717 [Aspergillus aculeatinus CBS 121060]RAH74457.1 hypothetical protein BO66DRAFT_397717 [Aspergillus aculeatinus CBS 121060]